MVAVNDQVIRAAGGLLWRPDQSLVCVVHRPRHDDWSLPKGKLLPGEHPLAAAVREVGEETGVRAVPQIALPPSRYRPRGTAQEKVVDFWAMVPRGDEPMTVDSEVDQVAWLAPEEAMRRLSYPPDRQLLALWRSLPPVTAVVLLVRHADAGARLADPVRDHQRPLSAGGTRDAAELCALLTLFAPHRLVSATPLRCRQTLEPLRARMATTANATAATGSESGTVALEPVFDEAADDAAVAAARLRTLAARSPVTVICSQGAVVPAVLQVLIGQDRPQLCPHSDAGQITSWATAKGDGWLLALSGPRLFAVAPLRLRA